MTADAPSAEDVASAEDAANAEGAGPRDSGILPPDDPVFTTELPPLPVLLRAARHYARLSQRELAERSGVSVGTIAGIEAGTTCSPGFPVVARLIKATGLMLRVLDPFAMPLYPRPLDHALDRGGRHWPSHLDVRQVRCSSDWWFGIYSQSLELPEFTADWVRLRGRTRVRRSKAQREADARARNTPGPREVTGTNAADG